MSTSNIQPPTTQSPTTQTSSAQTSPPQTSSPPPPPGGRKKWKEWWKGGKEWRDRYVGASIAISVFILMPLFLLTVLLHFYFQYMLPDTTIVVWLIPGITILVLLLLPLLFMRVATAEGGKLSDYQLIDGDLKVLEAQLHEAQLSPTQPGNELERLTIAEVQKDIEDIRNMLKRDGLIWVLRTGYIRVWDRMNKAQEAMINVLPRELVIESALYTRVQLSGSTVPNQLALIKDINNAIDTLSASSSSSTRSADEQKARRAIRQVQCIVHTYRCGRWEELVRARNQLLGTAWLASLLIYISLDVAILAQVPVETMRQMSIFFLLGATIGLFGRLLNEVHPNNAEIVAHMDDYGLTVARIMVTPFLSGLAALVGVPLAVAALAVLNDTLLSPVRSFAPYEFLTHPGYLLMAAVFGYLPNVVISLLQQQAQKVQSELVSSGPGSGKGEMSD